MGLELVLQAEYLRKSVPDMKTRQELALALAQFNTTMRYAEGNYKWVPVKYEEIKKMAEEKLFNDLLKVSFDTNKYINNVTAKGH
jgi:hypothetical protein